MLNPFKKSQPEQSELTWDAQAEQALEQATAQAPVPGPMKKMMANELRKAAEKHTRNAGSNVVTAQHLMEGMLAKMPDNMRSQVEDAMKKGPDGLEQLKKDLE